MMCECGERLLAAVGDETITTVEGDQMVFRRRSDYVLCPRCLKLYTASQLRGPEGAEMVGDASVFAELDSLPLEDQFG